jgi:recombinational DNA repair protein RecT
MNHPHQEQPTEKQIEARRVAERKSHVIKALQAKFDEPLWKERLLKIAGGDMSFVTKAFNSFITTLANDEGVGDKGSIYKRYITDCSLGSISSSFLLSFQMGIEVGGGRDHAYLVNYDGQCELEVSYKGFAYALHKHFDNAFLLADCVFEGDEFTCEITDTSATYTFRPANAFNRDKAKFQGVFCYFSYTLKDGNQVSRLVRVSRSDVDMAMSKSKGSWAWKDFYYEMAKKVAYRNASKIPFATIDFGDDEVNPEVEDNRSYQLEGRGGGNVGRIEHLMSVHRENIYGQPKEKEQVSGAAQAVDGVQPDAQRTESREGVVSEQPQVAVDVEGQDVYHHSADANRAAVDEGAGSVHDEGAAGTAQAVQPVHDRRTEDEAQAVEGEGKSEVWDGRSIYSGEGKKTEVEFSGTSAAVTYLRRVMASRKSKDSRKKLLELNAAMVGQASVELGMEVLQGLHRLADQGE